MMTGSESGRDAVSTQPTQKAVGVGSHFRASSRAARKKCKWRASVDGEDMVLEDGGGEAINDGARKSRQHTMHSNMEYNTAGQHRRLAIHYFL